MRMATPGGSPACATLEMADVVRLTTSAGSWRPGRCRPGETAVVGKWVPVPGPTCSPDSKWNSGASAHRRGPGEITSTCSPATNSACRDEDPAIRVRQADNLFLPHNYPANCVAYTGTHDNDTHAVVRDCPGGREGLPGVTRAATMSRGPHPPGGQRGRPGNGPTRRARPRRGTDELTWHSEWEWKWRMPRGLNDWAVSHWWR